MQESEKRFELSSPGYGSTKRPPLPNINSQISRLHFESTRVRLIYSSNSAKQQIIQAQVYFSVPCRNISSSHARFKILVFVSEFSHSNCKQEVERTRAWARRPELK